MQGYACGQDAALNLPEEKRSHGLRKLAAVESARGSHEAACDAVARATGVRIGKRQLEELARRAAAHVEAFYLQRVISPAPEAWPLVLTFDGEGIVMLPDALRPATAKAAASAEDQLPDGGRHRRRAEPRRPGHHRHRLHPRAGVPLESRLVLLR